MSQVLDLALKFEEHLVWVDLKRWQWQRTVAQPVHFADGLADLYFDGLGSTATGTGGSTEPRPAVRARLEESLAQIEGMAAPPPNLPYRHYRQSTWEAQQQVCSLDEPPFRLGEPPPHPLCNDKLRLRLETFGTDAIQPLFGGFEALAGRVQQRQSWEQVELRW